MTRPGEFESEKSDPKIRFSLISSTFIKNANIFLTTVRIIAVVSKELCSCFCVVLPMNYLPLIAMQLNVNPEITLKQRKSIAKLLDKKCLSSIHNLDYKQKR